MSKVFVIDTALCSGCYSCQMACKDEHCDNDWSPYAKPQPDTGQFWMQVGETVRGTIPKVKVTYTPRLCNHCDKPACLAVCPVGAVSKREDGLVLIDPGKCDGCGKCREACPYDVIYLNAGLNIAQKCTGCAHLLDAGKKLPRCVEACPTEALRFGERDEMAEDTLGAQVLKPELGLGPNVFYRNVPGQFIAGTLYDPVVEEIVKGARCMAVSGGVIVNSVSDEFGDFWFRDLAVGKYDITITAKGFQPKYFYSVSTKECVNLGDIPLERA